MISENKKIIKTNPFNNLADYNNMAFNHDFIHLLIHPIYSIMQLSENIVDLKKEWKFIRIYSGFEERTWTVYIYQSIQ